MPTIITHAAVPLLLGAAAGSRRISHRLLAAGAIAAMLPDADVLGFKFGIGYATAFGHRGASHSIAFALLLGLLAAALHRPLRSSAWCAFGFVGLAALSHPLLDALTNGGLGVALAWPWDLHRYFFPFRPIEVSPIGARFFSARGWVVIQSELLWVWLPAALLALTLWRWRLRHDRHGSTVPRMQ
ncbi:metal-dependent hydrolase [Dyella tabacisoli]|uniref:Metal-dependent hydrolase n=1 Tax=Dyella tabacisoli TaxID=2282381 RepID=A0A369UYN5_9GAMM|nr:metal-dependent hydrolase [Dyella tabacisoli]RDD83449.1 metal-dependent hydrolase [Dyella tabacisoli]